MFRAGRAFICAFTLLLSQSTFATDPTPADLPFYLYPVDSICIYPFQTSSSEFGDDGQLPYCTGEEAEGRTNAREANSPVSISGIALVAEKDTMNPSEEIKFRVNVVNAVKGEPAGFADTVEDGRAAHQMGTNHLIRWLGVPPTRPVIQLTNIGNGCLLAEGHILKPGERGAEVTLDSTVEGKVRRGAYSLNYYIHKITVKSVMCPPALLR